VVGYGMDFNEVYRDIKHLAIVNEVSHSDIIEHHHDDTKLFHILDWLPEI
jgi:hypothetical protein